MFAATARECSTQDPPGCASPVGSPRAISSKEPAHVMKRSYIIGAIVAVVAVAAIVFYMRSKQEQVVEDLVAIFPDDARAEKRSSLSRDLAYKAGPETIKGETKPSIFMHPNSRLTFKRITI